MGLVNVVDCVVGCVVEGGGQRAQGMSEEVILRMLFGLLRCDGFDRCVFWLVLCYWMGAKNGVVE